MSERLISEIEREIDGLILPAEGASFDALQEASASLVRIRELLDYECTVENVRSRLGPNFIGPEAYETLLGKSYDGPVPPIDGAILGTLLADPDMAARHRLVFVPAELRGERFTIASLARMEAEYCSRLAMPSVFILDMERYHPEERYLSVAFESPRWILMLEGDPFGMSGKTNAEQVEILKGAPGYRTAKALELTAACTMNCLQNRRYLDIYGRCDDFDNAGMRLYGGHHAGRSQFQICPFQDENAYAKLGRVLIWCGAGAKPF